MVRPGSKMAAIGPAAGGPIAKNLRTDFEPKEFNGGHARPDNAPYRTSFFFKTIFSGKTMK